MLETLLPLLVVLWAAWAAQAVLAALQVRKFLRRRMRRTTPHHFRGLPPFHPPAAVIVPFKGVDEDLEENVRRLCSQDYPDYRLLFVVESAEDPAWPILQSLIAAHSRRRIELLIAGQAGPRQGQKVHNQLAALHHLETAAAGEQVWVFADSDAAPGPDWLRHLVTPLGRDAIGVSTGYRWLVPPQGTRASLWTHLASVINSSAACFYGRERHNHAWGGAMAVRSATARQCDLPGYLRGALTDDYQFTRMARDHGLRVHFVPECLVASPTALSLAGLLNFAHRQYLITRVYQPRLFWGGLALTGLYVAGFVSAWAGLAAFLGRDPADWGWLWPAAPMAVVFIANQARAGYRRRVVRHRFGPEAARSLRPALRLDRWATPLWMGLNFLLLLRTAFGRTMNWRGIRYRLHAPQRVERLG